MQTKGTIDPMKHIVETLRKTPNRLYTATEIAELKLMPWARSSRTIAKIIDADMAGPNLLKAVITGAATQRRYTVKGRYLISYLKEYGPGLMTLVRKPKRK